MEKDYEDIDGIDELTDGELRALIRDRLEEQVAFDPNDVEVAVRGGVVRLSGRVGTEQELRIVEHVVTDLVGIKEVKNDLVVDPIRRAESPVPIDEHLVDEELHEEILLGDRPRPEDPEAEHLHEDIRGELFGTTDVQESIEEGIPWNPPDGPTPEGEFGPDAPPNVMNDDH
ncbi:MAG TPA: BON domain-containing protein [Gemmatimonadaceae bacterium]|nr:BON domain-containing protein [Gemmatimonadaceae bacterium]